jgi:hypothetical protein
VKPRLLLVLGLVGLLSVLVAGPAGAAEGTTGRSISPVTSISNGSLTGYSVLARTDSGVRFRLFTTQLEAHHAFTVWWVVFNHPEHCAGAATSASPRCGMADMTNPDVDASALRADGDVAARWASAGSPGRWRWMTTPRPLPARACTTRPVPTSTSWFVTPRCTSLDDSPRVVMVARQRPAAPD